MIVDSLLEFVQSADDVIINIGNSLVGDVVDTGSTNTLKDLGAGEPLYLVILVTTAFVGSSSTIKFELCSDSAVGLDSSKTTHISTPAVAEATMVAGYTQIYPLPISATYERYLGIWETVAAGNLSAGAARIFITKDPSKWTAYADALTTDTVG